MKAYSLFLFLIIGLGMVSDAPFFNSYAVDDSQGNQSKIKITVSYSNDTSVGYTVHSNIDQKHAISQVYSWASNKFGRFNLLAYSIDNGSFVPIKRESNGNITLDILADHDHTIVFLAKPQFKIITSGTDKVAFYPPSPTNDTWFDAGTNVQIIIPYILPSHKENTRQQLNGWTLDDSYINVISRQESGFFKSPLIHMSSMHMINLDYKIQYYIKVISDFGRVFGTGWYDSGTIVDISVSSADDMIIRHFFTGWQGSVIGNGNQDEVSVISDSPKIITASWLADYTNVSIVVIIVISLLVLLIIYQKRKRMPTV